MKRLVTDPVDALLDLDWDIQFLDGDLVLSRGLPAVTQQIAIALKTVKGEWFLDETIGVPYFTNILGKKFSLGTVQQIVREAIQAIDSVVSIERLAVDFDALTRKCSVDFVVKTTFGDTIAESLKV
jgi:hypothetical protein